MISPVGRLREASQKVRQERVGAHLQRLRQGDLDAARWESTPRLRAERLAAVLTRSLSRGAMRRRLQSLGVSAQYSGGTLTAISVEGGGLDVRRADGRGVLLTGPGIDRRLLAVFPELAPFTLTASTYQIPPDATDVDVSVSNPALSGSNALRLDLSVYGIENLASSAVARYIVSGTGLGMGGSFGAPTVTDPFGSQAGGAVYPQNVDVTWDAAGVNWIEIFSGQANASPGNKQVSFTTSYTSWTVGLSFEYCTVTYTTPPCETCSLVIEVTDACNGDAVGAAVFTLSNGLSCTTAGNGECTISNIPDGSYTYTLTKNGYVTETGSFSCECLEGGETVLSFILDRTGGCKPPPDPNPEDPVGVLAGFQGWARRWRSWFNGPVRLTQPNRDTSGECAERGGVSVSSSGECASTGGISTSEGGECGETGGISTDAGGECDETGGVTST